jgi:hypothetical protein
MCLHPEQIKILKSLSPDAKLKLAEKLYTSARALKAAVIRQQHPHWSEEKVAVKVKEIFLYART